MIVQERLVDLSCKLSSMASVAKNAVSEQVSHYQMGVFDGRADGLLEAANHIMMLALELQNEERENGSEPRH